MFGLPASLDAPLRGVILTAIALVWILLLVRIIGLRSFSKMTAFDFVATIAAGSLLASLATVSTWTDFAQDLAALTTLFSLQWLLARGRKSSKAFKDLIGNEPILLMEDGVFVEPALEQTRVAREDVYAKIRASNAPSVGAVRAVVLETTGDISVLHGSPLDEEMLKGVRRLDHARAR
ncbi:MAG: DUF421 domain-containing protein [Alphaproteobacteria bacterium]|nr:DUF421 domain-containing protein [Alphaproteobacteria bacterium]